VKLLHKNGANFEIPEPKEGLLPIHIACQSGNLEVVKYLVEVVKVNREAECKKWTPLFHAVFHAKEPIAYYLLKLGVNATFRDKDYNGILHLTIYSSSKTIFDVILSDPVLSTKNLVINGENS